MDEAGGRRTSAPRRPHDDDVSLGRDAHRRRGGRTEDDAPRHGFDLSGRGQRLEPPGIPGWRGRGALPRGDLDGHAVRHQESPAGHEGSADVGGQRPREAGGECGGRVESGEVEVPCERRRPPCVHHPGRSGGDHTGATRACGAHERRKFPRCTALPVQSVMGVDPELHVVEHQRAPAAACTSQVSQELADQAGLTRVDDSSEGAVTAPWERGRHEPDLIPWARDVATVSRRRTSTARVSEDEERPAGPPAAGGATRHQA